MSDQVKKGRPNFEVTQHVLDEVEKLTRLGVTQKVIANSFGITYRCFAKHKNKNPELKQKCKKGEAGAISYAAGKLMQLIKAGNVTAIIFFLKTRAGYRDNSTVVVKNNVKSKKHDYKIDTMDPIEASKIYQSIMTGSYKDE